MRYFIETSVIVGYLRGRSESIRTLDGLEGELTSSYVCWAELYEGVFRVREKEKAERAVKDFFAGLSEVFGLDEEIAKRFGEVRADLKRKGQVIEDLDIFLAATCLACDLIMVTGNLKHFARVVGLKLFKEVLKEG